VGSLGRISPAFRRWYIQRLDAKIKKHDDELQELGVLRQMFLSDGEIVLTEEQFQLMDSLGLDDETRAELKKRVR